MTFPRTHKEQPETERTHKQQHVCQTKGEGGFYLDEVNREPLTDPKQDRPTNTGMIHAIGPR